MSKDHFEFPESSDIDKDDIIPEAELSGLNLNGATISEAYIPESDISESSGENADLSGACLVNSNLSHSDFSNIDFSNADLVYADISNADLSNGNLYDTDCYRADFSNATLEGTDLSNADLERANFSNADLRNADLSNSFLLEANLSNANLEGADLSNSNVGLANVSNANLQEANLSNSSFQEAKLQGVNLKRAKLSGAILIATDLTGAGAIGVNFAGVDLRGASIPKYMRETNLSDAILSSLDLSDKSFYNSDLSNADISQTNLSGATFHEANLSGADLWGADLSGARLNNANLEDAKLSQADMSDANLEGANLARADLFYADLSGSELYGSILSDIRINERTEFGSHYNKYENLDKIFWSLSKIEDIARRNARPNQVQDAFTKRKDLRRQYYWHNSKFPYIGRKIVRWGKFHLKKKKSFVYWNIRNVISNKNTNRSRLSDENETTEPHFTDYEAVNSMRNKQNDNWTQWTNTSKWAWSALTGLLMRYGESPRRVVGMSALTVLMFGFLYPFAGGIIDGANVYQLADPSDLLTADGIAVLSRSQYFSAITFTTIGYANVAPLGAGSRILVTLESFIGALLLATLVFVLGRRSTR